MTREVLSKFPSIDPDIIAIQETKLPITGMSKKIKTILSDIAPEYEMAYSISEPPARKSYAGTLFLYKNHMKPLVSYPKIGAPDTMDLEGRLISLEFDDFFVSQVYTPNAGSGLNRLKERQLWDQAYRKYLMELDQKKPLITMGDYNVAHEPIDLAHPDNNHESAGFTDEEREGFSQLLDAGFTDTFRALHGPVEGVYSWWTQRVPSSKKNNSGWRIDYFLVSNRIKDKVLRSEMVNSGERQDHCPIYLEIDI